jgi:hypothetical protein
VDAPAEQIKTIAIESFASLMINAILIDRISTKERTWLLDEYEPIRKLSRGVGVSPMVHGRDARATIFG